MSIHQRHGEGELGFAVTAGDTDVFAVAAHDGFHDIQFAKYGRADKSLINEKPTEFTSGGAPMYYFYDVNNIIGEGATREYGIMQIYVDETHYVRLAISMSSGKVYRQGSNISSVTAWNEISTSIPVLSADPSNPSEGQMWIIAS